MQELSALIGIAIALSIGAASPGPSFVVVAKAAASSRSHGLSSALGMGVGGLFFAILALLGLNSLFLAIPTLYAILKILGGLYLAYLGFKIWRGADEPLNTNFSSSLNKEKALSAHFISSLITQLSNPKTAIVYTSIFATFLPSETSFAFNFFIAIIVFSIETSWYSLVALALSTERSRAGYLKSKKIIDHIAGGVMFLLGIKLVSSVHSFEPL